VRPSVLNVIGRHLGFADPISCQVLVLRSQADHGRTFHRGNSPPVFVYERGHQILSRFKATLTFGFVLRRWRRLIFGDLSVREETGAGTAGRFEAA